MTQGNTNRMTVYSIFIADTTGEATETHLAKACKTCDGIGTVALFASRSFEECKACKGTGTRLTYLGVDLLNFINEYRDHPDMAEDADLQD